MSPGELGRIIRARLEAELPRPTVRRIHLAAGGNPFFAVEIAREVLRRGVPVAGEALPVPDDLTDLLQRRVMALPIATQKALLFAASTSHPTRHVVRAASGLGDRTDLALASAESAGVVHPGGHEDPIRAPLAGLCGLCVCDHRGTTQGARPQLAEQVDHSEERARHLALSSVAPDTRIAAALDQAADLARRRGAPDSAAELAELGRRLTPIDEDDDLRRRTVQASRVLLRFRRRAEVLGIVRRGRRGGALGARTSADLFHLAAIAGSTSSAYRNSATRRFSKPTATLNFSQRFTSTLRGRASIGATSSPRHVMSRLRWDTRSRPPRRMCGPPPCPPLPWSSS